LDVDHFKLINDRHGHAVGDAVLAAVSRLIGSIVRSCDVVARWGGEEFVIALPSTALDWGDVGRRPHPCGARAAPDRRSQRAKRDGHRQLWVAQPEPGEAVDQLVDRADRAMYAAKSAGRNRVLSTTQLVPVLQSVTPQSITRGAPLALANAAFTPKKAAEC